MAVFWRVVFADDEMGAVGREIVLVNPAELVGFGGDIGLEREGGTARVSSRR